MIHGVLICFYTSPGDMPRVYNVYTCAVQEEFWRRSAQTGCPYFDKKNCLHPVSATCHQARFPWKVYGTCAWRRVAETWGNWRRRARVSNKLRRLPFGNMWLHGSHMNMPDHRIPQRNHPGTGLSIYRYQMQCVPYKPLTLEPDLFCKFHSFFGWIMYQEWNWTEFEDKNFIKLLFSLFVGIKRSDDRRKRGRGFYDVQS
jgi:hypothetical protein